MLATVLQAEVDAYVAQFVDERDANGRRLVVRNGSHQPRQVLTSAGAVRVQAPRVNDKRVDPATGERARFASAILPAWCRKSPKVTEVLPLLYRHGLSTSDFGPALGQFLGSSAGLSAPVIDRLCETWQGDPNQRRSAAAAATVTSVQEALALLSGQDDEQLLVAGRLRLAHPQASLEQLGALADPPMTKDAVAGRLRRLLARADRRAVSLGLPTTRAAESPGLLPAVDQG